MSEDDRGLHVGKKVLRALDDGEILEFAANGHEIEPSWSNRIVTPKLMLITDRRLMVVSPAFWESRPSTSQSAGATVKGSRERQKAAGSDSTSGRWRGHSTSARPRPTPTSSRRAFGTTWFASAMRPDSDQLSSR